MNKGEAISIASALYYDHNQDIWIMKDRIQVNRDAGYIVIVDRRKVGPALMFSDIHEYWSQRLKVINCDATLRHGFIIMSP